MYFVTLHYYIQWVPAALPWG